MGGARISLRVIVIVAIAFLILASILWVTGNARPAMLLASLGGVVVGVFAGGPLNSLLMKIGQRRRREDGFQHDSKQGGSGSLIMGETIDETGDVRHKTGDRPR